MDMAFWGIWQKCSKFKWNGVYRTLWIYWKPLDTHCKKVNFLVCELSLYLPCDPSIPLLFTQEKKVYFHTKFYTWMFIEDLFVTVKIWKYTNVYQYDILLLSSKKHSTIWMNIRILVLSNNICKKKKHPSPTSYLMVRNW